MFTLKEFILHGKKKYQIVYTEGGKHVAYINDLGEARTLIRLLNRKD